MMHKAPGLSAGVVILPIYFLGAILIGWTARRHNRSANSYLSASHSLPLWIVTPAYLATNCGALEIIGISAMAAQYGVSAFHFYWIGAIPAMVFLSIWMMPVYRRSGVGSVPQYLEVRYGHNLRLLNACIFALTMLLLAGISLYAMAQTLRVLFEISFLTSILICAGVVLAYILPGGIRATIYNEVFQLIVMIAGIAPVALYSFRHGAVSFTRGQGFPSHLWAGLPLASDKAPFDAIGVVIGLGFVLSFGYWCTDFVQMQRAFTARTEIEARRVPLWAGFGKLLFSLLLVIPGLAAAHLLPELGSSRRFDQALPELMTVLYSPAMLGLGFTALAASLMSGLAANASAFSAIWTEDIYRAHLRRHESESHYVAIGRIAVCAAVIFGAMASYIDFLFGNLMEHVQLIFSIFGAPLWAVFLLGMTTRRYSERGAIVAYLGGAAIALLHLIAFSQKWIAYGSMMSANFHAAIYAFCTAMVLGLVVKPSSTSQPIRSEKELTFQWKGSWRDSKHALWPLAILLIASCVALNLLWR